MFSAQLAARNSRKAPMPVEFLSDEQAAGYSRYHANPSLGKDAPSRQVAGKRSGLGFAALVQSTLNKILLSANTHRTLSLTVNPQAICYVSAMPTPALLEKLKNHYRKLLPDPRLLLAVFKLYTDFGGPDGLHESFDEYQLRAAFMWAGAQLRTGDTTGSRVLYEQYNTDTYALFDFILNRNLQEGTYRLSAYALQLCRLLGNTLFHEVKATSLATFQ